MEIKQANMPKEEPSQSVASRWSSKALTLHGNFVLAFFESGMRNVDRLLGQLSVKQ